MQTNFTQTSWPIHHPRGEQHFARHLHSPFCPATCSSYVLDGSELELAATGA